MIETHTDTHTHPRTERAFPFSFDTSELAALGKKRLPSVCESASNTALRKVSFDHPVGTTSDPKRTCPAGCLSKEQRNTSDFRAQTPR
jgi:hypothetical protein